MSTTMPAEHRHLRRSDATVRRLVSRDTRGRRGVADPSVAFVASLAVGLASAAWEPQRAASELAAAADEDPHVLQAAHARVLDRFLTDAGEAVRATRLLQLAIERVSPAVAS